MPGTALATTAEQDPMLLTKPRVACGAKCKDGKPCPRAPMPNGKCWRHGGKTPRGIAAGSYKHGQRSSIFPTRLRERLNEYLEDPLLLEGRFEIAALNARYDEVALQCEQGESGQLWYALHDHAEAFRKARGKDEQATKERAVQAILAGIDAGYNDRQNWQELREIKQELRLLRESERKLMLERQQVIDIPKVNLLVGAISHAFFQACDIIMQVDLKTIAPADLRKRVLTAAGGAIEKIMHTGQ